VAGLDMLRDPAGVRRQIGYVAQGGGTVAERKVVEELVLQATLYGMSRHAARRRAAEVAEQLDLGDLLDRLTGSLSGGQRRRLDIGLGLVHTPRLLFLDEPTTGLDPESRRRTWDAIQELQEAGRTVVLTTHYLEEAEALADRVAIMHAGEVAVRGTLSEIVAAQPASFSAGMPVDAPPLPALTGKPELTDGRPQVHTSDLQADLTNFLGWAAHHGIALRDLRAAPASLADIYHAVRMQQEDSR
ncbi:MAG: ABC transporter ATP-binding protein, partial [Actinomycetes bacterium]